MSYVYKIYRDGVLHATCDTPNEARDWLYDNVHPLDYNDFVTMFEDYIDDTEGEVEILGYNLTASYVLRECDPYAYREAADTYFYNMIDSEFYDFRFGGSEVLVLDYYIEEVCEEVCEEDCVPDNPFDKVFRYRGEGDNKEVYLHMIIFHDEDIDCETIARQLNDRAIRLFEPWRYFATGAGYHPTRAEVAMGL